MLHEKYRPRTFAEFAGNTKVVDRLRRMLARSDFNGGALFFSGPSGSGKTTLALLVARQFADEIAIDELDGDKCTVDAVRALSDTLAISPMIGTWKAIIVNEAHAMTPRAVQAWLTLLERLPPRRLVIFTTTESGEIFGSFTAPMLSRCARFNLDNVDVASFEARAQSICQTEGMDAPDVDYASLVRECAGNMRDVVSRIMSFDLPSKATSAPPAAVKFVPKAGSAMARAMAR